MNDVAVLVPAYNESLTIGNVVRRCRRYCPVVLVVDDGSADGTALEAQRHGAAVLRNDSNLGLGSSLRRGLSLLQAENFQCVVTLDGDGAHEPESIPMLVQEHLRTGADLTIGSRFLDSKLASGVPAPKLAANRFATYLLNHVVGCSLTDVASGMRVIGKRLISQSFTRDDFSISYEIISAALRYGFTLREYPIPVYYDPEVLFCTKQSELLDLLDFVAVSVEDAHFLQARVSRLIQEVKGYRTIRVKLGSFRFVLHPVRDYGAFVFQEKLLTSADENWLSLWP